MNNNQPQFDEFPLDGREQHGTRRAGNGFYSDNGESTMNEGISFRPIDNARVALDSLRARRTEVETAALDAKIGESPKRPRVPRETDEIKGDQ